MQVPDTAKVFEHRSTIHTTLDKIEAFHQDPAAFSKLTPPPIIAQIHKRDLQSLTEGTLEFTLWFGPIPIRWMAQHEQGPTPHSFADRMMQGPMQYWLHQHIFEQTDDGITLIDRITIAHKPGLQGVFTRLIFDGLPLRFLFIYRHLRTKMATQ